jgi:type III secretion protein L
MGRLLKGRGVVDAGYLAALESSRELVHQADRTARHIERRARERADEILDRARTEGLEQGRARAAAELIAAQAVRRENLERSLEDVVELSLRVGERLYGQAIAADRSWIERLCREAIRKLASEHACTLTVAPSDREPALRAVRTCAAEVRVVEDADMLPGGCIVRSEGGQVDASVETRLEGLRRALGEVASAAGGGEGEP